jgi:hypothetical protein
MYDMFMCLNPLCVKYTYALKVPVVVQDGSATIRPTLFCVSCGRRASWVEQLSEQDIADRAALYVAYEKMKALEELSL